METGVHIPSSRARGPTVPSAPRARGRKPARELALAAALVVALGILARPGIGLAAVLAVAALVARAVGHTVVARWRLAHGGSRRGPRRRGRAGLGRRAVAIVTAAAVLTLVLATLSYLGAVTRPSNSSLAIRSVEWLRDNGGAGLVSSVERFYYTLTAPAKGGPALLRLPGAGVAGQAGAARAHGQRRNLPRTIRATIHPRLPGEGVWHSTQARFAADPSPPIVVTTYRPDPSYPRVVAGLAWIDPRRAKIALYPGLQEPPGGAPRGPAEIPAARRGGLLATFNSGFKHSDSGGGFFAHGRLFEPMKSGLASVVATRDGRVDVRTWHGGARPGLGVVAARQNLPLIVDRGRPNPSLSDGPKWGSTVGNAVLVWRSGIGVNRRGDLIYAAANDQTAGGLARILIHAGAVRAMELDINSYWVTFNTYAKSAARGSRKLLPGMTRPATRYLTADDRDFFSVYVR